MAKNITIPKLGMTMTEAKILEWKFGEGNMVNKGQVVLVLETAKVTYDLEALDSGYLHIIHPPEVVLGVGEIAGQLAESEGELRALQRDASGASRGSRGGEESFTRDQGGASGETRSG